MFQSGPGSPKVSSFNERAVAHVYGVPPFQPNQASVFPYLIVWPKHLNVVSSFGKDATKHECGIWSRDQGRMIAHCELIKTGDPLARGEDCGLIVVCRVSLTNPKREQHPEGLMVAGMGIGGPGTKACFEAFCSPKNAAELYPPELDKPIMRIVRCKYGRSGPSKGRDDRFLDGWELLPLPGSPKTKP